MRLSTIALAFGALFLTGCSDLISVSPFVTEKQATIDRGLTGVWTNAKEDETYYIRQDGKGYSIFYQENELPMKFDALLFEVGDARLLDLTARSDNPFHLPVHAVVRVWISGSTLRFAFLDSKWLREHAAKLLASQLVGEEGPKTNQQTLLTAHGDYARTFLQKYGADDRAYDEPVVLHRAQ